METAVHFDEMQIDCTHYARTSYPVSRDHTISHVMGMQTVVGDSTYHQRGVVDTSSTWIDGRDCFTIKSFKCSNRRLTVDTSDWLLYQQQQQQPVHGDAARHYIGSNIGTDAVDDALGCYIRLWREAAAAVVGCR